jgi:PhzF family phenazine biosynthesis protein
MKKIKIYQVDAFTDKLFGGNPAAVCLFAEWPDEKVMQNIAAENNLAETAFVLQDNKGFSIRWFTPTVEVDLCGHATLAAAHVIFTHENYRQEEILFHSRVSGILKVTRNGDNLALDFPADNFEKVEITPQIISALRLQPQEVYRGKTDYMAVLKSQSEIEQLEPDLNIIRQLNCRGLIVTSPGTDCDFVSRFFAPQSGIDEDPVTGSAHTTLTPYWSERLNKKHLSAIQLSPRKGYLSCIDNKKRVNIEGRAVTYLEGIISIQ